ncbi:MAG: hypothetical protein HXS52_09505 [Theionarchaea archaeon]|nr:hypothetical protein [Theionarchaea archaeon]
MIDFIGAVVASFVLGFIIGLRIQRLPAMIYIVLFLVILVLSYFVGDYPFYTFQVGRDILPINSVLITSYLGIVVGSVLPGGGGGSE